MTAERETWYRGASWTQSDQEAFWARLRRSRGAWHRAQYLRIQAFHLEEAGILEPAVVLLEHALSEEPEGFESGEIHHQLATCREKQGRISEAVEHLRRALNIAARGPSRASGVWLTFGRVAVEHGRHELYEEFLALVDKADRAGELNTALMFPADRYRFAGILAVINAHLGNKSEARHLADTALQAANETTSGLRYHPQLGVVSDKETTLYRLVVEITRDG